MLRDISSASCRRPFYLPWAKRLKALEDEHAKLAMTSVEWDAKAIADSTNAKAGRLLHLV